jgi:hypothetical protein
MNPDSVYEAGEPKLPKFIVSPAIAVAGRARNERVRTAQRSRFMWRVSSGGPPAAFFKIRTKTQSSIDKASAEYGCSRD